MSSWYRNLPSVQEIELTLSQAGLTNVKLHRRQIEAWLEDLRLNYNQCSSESDIPEWMNSRTGILHKQKRVSLKESLPNFPQSSTQPALYSIPIWAEPHW